MSETLISLGIRFGYGSHFIEDREQYYAFYGTPSRNDDYFTTAEISLSEYQEIQNTYPVRANLSREEADIFKARYITGHPIIFEAWNRWL